MTPEQHRGEAVLRFGILGPLRIDVDGHEVPLDSPRQRALLGALLVEAGAVVSTDRLADILWGDDLPDDPSGGIHVHMSRLRGLLQRSGAASARDLLVTHRGGYALVLDPDRVDAGRFERLVRSARAAPAPQDRVVLTGAALQLWRGAAALPECTHARGRAEAGRLEELRTAALELRVDALLRLGRYHDVVAELAAPIDLHPFRERLRGQLMVALYRSGRQAEALATYRDLREELVAELGVEPSAALRALERAILRHAEPLPWPAPSAGTGAGTSSPGGGRRPSRQGRTALSQELTTFIGRQADVRAIADALRESRIVVLTGVGGVGKSRLAGRVARELAEDYADGVALCDLAGVDDPGAVPDAVATGLGMSPSTRGSADGLTELLRGQRLLLVLDNCEHVRAGVAPLVDRIGRRCRDVDVLATSRAPLGALGQRVWPVAPLDVAGGSGSAAVELFHDRAAAADPAYDRQGVDREAVVEICRRLDGLPLAIELAAARTRAMTPADIAERLDDRFGVLTGAPGAAPPRHHSLQAALDWSYALLPAGTQRLFDRLAIFAGGFGLDDAVRVCSGDGVPAHAVAGWLGELVDQSLVAVDRSERHARLWLLDSLRAYGEAHLARRGELSTWRRRHAEHCLDSAERAAEGLHGPEEGRWVRLLDAGFADLRLAHSRACASSEVEVALRIPGLLPDYAYHGLRDEVYRWAERALRLPGASARPAHPAALLTAAIGRMQRGELDRALEDGGRVVAATSDEALVLRATQLAAEIALYQGRLDDADRRGEELVRRARSTGDPYFEALGRLYRVHAAAYGGQPEEARAHLDAGWPVVERAGTPTLRAGYTYLEGEVRLDAAPEVALAALHQAIAASHLVGNRFLAGVARVAVASLEARHGRPDDALRAFREIIAHWRASGDWVHLWTTLHNLVVLLERVGADDAAAVLHGAVRTASTGAQAFGADAARLGAAAAALRRSLGDRAFAAADTRGRCMSDQDAVTFALEQVDRLLAEPSVGGRG